MPVRRPARLLLAALLVSSAVGPAVPSLPVAGVAAASVPAGASAFVPLTPARLADTRPGADAVTGYHQVDARTIRVPVRGIAGVPADASAVVVNLTAVAPSAAGFVTAHPSGEALPAASSLNVDRPGRVISNLATVRVGADGAIQIHASVAVSLVVDVVGAYVPRSSAVAAGRLETLPGGARRALDTRETSRPWAAGETRTVDLATVGVPSGASAAVVNLVAADGGVGFWTAFPNGGDRPLASSLNLDEPGQTRSAQAIVALPAGTRSFQLFAQTGGHLVVDVAGWFTGASSAAATDGLFVPSNPRRVLDTRTTFEIAPWGDTTIEFGTGSPFPADTAAVALNVAATGPWYVGYVTAHPAGVTRPGSSNLNITSFDQIVANHAVVRAGTRGLAVYTQSGTHLVADVAGWYLGRPEVSVLPEARADRSGPTTAVGIAAPTIGVQVAIGTHRDIDVVIDSGKAGLWLGSGAIGREEHNIYFAHRTSHGGVFRTIDRLVVGATFSVVGADGRTYQYLVTRQDVVLPIPAELLKVVRAGGPSTVTLVACHPPGSIRYRLAVTGRLIGVAP